MPLRLYDLIIKCLQPNYTPSETERLDVSKMLTEWRVTSNEWREPGAMGYGSSDSDLS